MSLTRIPVPWRGMDLNSAPDYVKSGQGTLARNLVPGRPGQIVPRGPIQAWYDLPVITGGWDAKDQGAGGFWTQSPNIVGVVVDADAVLFTSATGTVRRIDGVGGNLAIPGGAGGLASSFANLPQYTVGPLVGNLPLLTWTNVDALALVTPGPYRVTAVCEHQTRLFALGGTVPGTGAGGTYRNNIIYWTDPAPNLSGAAAGMWQDDVTGLVNQIDLPATDIYRDIVTFNRVVYIFGDRTTLALSGDTPATYTLRRVLDIGAPLVPGGHAAVTERGIYFRSQAGIMRFDGAFATPVSDPVRPRITVDTWADLQPLPDGHVSVIVPQQWLLYHEDSGGWTELTSGQFGASTVHFGSRPAVIRRASANPVWWALSPGATGNPGRACRINTLTRPEEAWSVIGAPAVGTDGPFAIDAQALSPPIRLTTPDRRAQVQRLFAQALGGWTATLEDEDGNVLPLSVVLTTQPTRQRGEAGAFRETDVVRVRWTWTGLGYNQVPAAGDAYVLAETSQQR